MVMKVVIKDGRGTGNTAKINGEGEFGVVVHDHPPINEEVVSYPYSTFFENGGSNDMIVDGSTTNQTFSISALTDRDIYIKTVSVLISDNGARLNLFGALAAFLF